MEAKQTAKKKKKSKQKRSEDVPTPQREARLADQREPEPAPTETNTAETNVPSNQLSAQPNCFATPQITIQSRQEVRPILNYTTEAILAMEAVANMKGTAVEGEIFCLQAIYPEAAE